MAPMRTPTFLLTSLVTLALLAPAALAAEGQGSFLASPPVGLWGAVTWTGSEEHAAVLQHMGSAESWSLQAANLIVRVQTLQRGGSADGEASTEDHAFAGAAARGEEGAAFLLTLGPGDTLTIASSQPAPASNADAQRAPEAFAMLAEQGAATAQDCASPECRPRGAVSLVPLQPLDVAGPIQLMLLPGSAITVATAEGEQRFASEHREESRSSGGVALPLLGTVAPTRERVITETVVTLLADAASLHLVPSMPGQEPQPAAAAPPPPSQRGAPAPAKSERDLSTRLTTDTLLLDLRGTVGLHQAHGALEVAGEKHVARGEDGFIGGTLRLTLGASQAAQDSGLLSFGRSEGQPQLQVDVTGDVTSVDLGGASTAGGATLYQAAAVAGAAGAVGLLALFAPAAKYGFSRVMALPLYARLQRSELLDNRVRAQLLDLVRREPGASPAELAKQLTCSWNNLVYHLNVLEREGYLTRTREGRRWRFFPTGAQDHSALPALAALRNPRSARLVAAVKAQPGIAQHQLSATMAVKPSTVHWHMERLTQAGLVRAERAGRTVRYYEGPAAQHPQPEAGETAA